MNSQLDKLEEAIRRAALNRSFHEVDRLVGRYVAELEKLLRSVVPDSEEVRRHGARAQRCLDWVLAAVHQTRQEARQELSRTRLALSYGKPHLRVSRVRTQG